MRPWWQQNGLSGEYTHVRSLALLIRIKPSRSPVPSTSVANPFDQGPEDDASLVASDCNSDASTGSAAPDAALALHNPQSSDMHTRLTAGIQKDQRRSMGRSVAIRRIYAKLAGICDSVEAIREEMATIVNSF